MLERFESALREDSLHELTRAFIAEGLSQLEIYDLFIQMFVLVQDENCEADIDKVCDELELIWGWCHPSVAWFEHILTNEEVDQYRHARETREQRSY